MIKRTGDGSDAVLAARSLPNGSEAVIHDAANLFKLLSDPTRLRILMMLSERDEMCVRDLWERLGQSQPAVSHHLGLLRSGGVVDTRHAGKHIFYRINPPRFQEVLGALRLTQIGLRLATFSLRQRTASETPAEPVGVVPSADA